MQQQNQRAKYAALAVVHVSICCTKEMLNIVISALSVTDIHPE